MSRSKKIFIFLFFVTVAMPVSCEKYFAVGRGQGKVMLYTVGNWKQKQVIDLPKGASSRILFSPDGKYLALGLTCYRDLKVCNKIKIYHQTVGKEKKWEEVSSFGGETAFSAMAFSLDGKFFAHSWKDRKIIVRRTKDWKEITTLEVGGKKAEFYRIVFSDDGYLAGVLTWKKERFKGKSISNHIVKFWNTKNWKNFKDLDFKSDEISQISFIPNKKEIAVLQKISGATSEKIKFFNTKDWSEVEHLEKEEELKGKYQINNLLFVPIEFSPSGKYIALGFCGGKTHEGGLRHIIEIRDTNWKRISNFEVSHLTELKFSFDDKYFAAMGNDSVRIFGKGIFGNWSLIKSWRYMKKNISPYAIAFSPEIKPVKIKKKSAKKKKKKKKKKRKGDIEEIIEI